MDEGSEALSYGMVFEKKHHRLSEEFQFHQHVSMTLSLFLSLSSLLNLRDGRINNTAIVEFDYCYACARAKHATALTFKITTVVIFTAKVASGFEQTPHSSM